MSSVEKLFKTPSILNTLDLGDSIKTCSRNHYILLDRENPYIGVDLGQAYIYLDEKGLHRIYYKVVSSIKNLYHDNDYLIPIHGSLNSVLYLEPLTILVLSDYPGTNRFIVLHRNIKIYELDSVSKGLLSKKICSIIDLDIGFSGESIIAIAKTTRDKACRDLLIIGNRKGKFEYSEEYDLIPLNWNGEWYSYLKIDKKTVEQNIILHSGKKLKYILDKKLYGHEFLVKNTMVHYSLKNNIVVLNNGRELKAIDLENEKIHWQKLFEKGVNAEIHSMYLDEIAVYSGNSLFVLDIVNNNVLFSENYLSNISTAYITEEYLVTGFSNRLYIYERRGREFVKIGKYVIPGTIVNLHVFNKNLLITYLLPGNVLKTMHINLGEVLNIELNNISMSINSAAELPLDKYKASVKLIDENPPNIDIVEHMGKTCIAETSGLPGIYNVSIHVSIPGYLPFIADLIVSVKSIESIIKKITISEKPVYSIRGAYIPITIDLESSLDELYIVLTNSDKSIYGSTPLVSNLNPGEVSIPLHIMWAKKGVHDAELLVIGWSKRNRIYQKYSTTISFERDIPLLYYRVFSDTVYLWSPIDLGVVSIVTTTGDYRIELKQSINKGWNEIEALKGEFDELIVTLPSKVKYVARRGKSWIEFLK